MITQSVEEVLSGLTGNNQIIISKSLSLPAYLRTKVNIIEFNENQLPLDIEPQILLQISVRQLVQLIDYQLDKNSLQLISRHNFRQILINSERYGFKKVAKYCQEQIIKDCQNVKTYDDILTLGDKWGRFIYCSYRSGKEPDDALVEKVDKATGEPILNGILKNSFYESTINFKTVDRIVKYITNKNDSKIALVCFDGMGVAEWHLLKEYLTEDDFSFEEKYIFALIPTMTRISRSAIFYGSANKVYEITSQNEDKAFKEIFNERSVGFYREGQLQSDEQLLGIDTVKIIYNLFDYIAHKTLLPPTEKNKGMYFMNVHNYLEKSSIKKELMLLKEEGYKIWICSDHGCLVATGNGQVIDKYLIETSSKRATIIVRSELSKFYDTNIYEIPFVKDKVVLLAKDRTSFSYKNKIEITHGGITLDELIVPFVEVIS
ncbi:MAG: PglZ domain-containing protein [Candidatus Scalindua sp.]|nr:PglZ domain-containing protein [Candidatus Scalindua sp.]